MYKLLIVDDEYEIRMGLSNYFPWSQIGFEVVGQADDGASAYRFIKSQPVDVVLCDIRMPTMSGIDLAKELHKDRAGVKVVLLSGYREFEYARQALEYGVRDYIVKPTQYAKVVQIFSALKKELDASDGRDGEARGTRPYGGATAQIVELVRDYVQKNYLTATLEDSAKLVYMNPFYLSKYFKNKTGENFSDYLTKVKMQKAAEFLRDVKYKTYEVSSMTGYTNPKNFARAFKKYYGCTPREFRSGACGKEASP